jgi:hypothetical protein
MHADKFLKIFILFQGIYIFVTAIWGILDIQSFMAITGPKTDVWLVRTVSFLLIPYSFLCFYLYHNPQKLSYLAILCMFTMGLGLLSIDLYYYEQGVIRGVYLIDAFFQVIFLMIWFCLSCQLSKKKSSYKWKLK